MIARWLRTEVDVFDPHVQQPDSEHHSGEFLNPDEDFDAEITLVRLDESSLAYPPPVNGLRVTAEWTQSIP